MRVRKCVCVAMCKHVCIHYLCVSIFMERREQKEQKKTSKRERKRKRVSRIKSSSTYETYNSNKAPHTQSLRNILPIGIIRFQQIRWRYEHSEKEERERFREWMRASERERDLILVTGSSDSDNVLYVTIMSYLLFHWHIYTKAI